MKELRKAVILFGPPGSGKTTVGRRLSKEDNVFLMETGHMLRSEVQRQSALGRELKPYLDKGRLAPSGLVKRVIIANLPQDDAEFAVFDGYPRLLDEINDFFEVEIRRDFLLSAVFVLEISKKDAITRLSRRRICASCGAVYNLISSPPDEENVCDVCGGKLKQRKDDKKYVIEKRWDAFEKESQPVIEHFQKRYPKRTVFIQASRSMNEVINDIYDVLNEKGLPAAEHCYTQNCC